MPLTQCIWVSSEMGSKRSSHPSQWFRLRHSLTLISHPSLSFLLSCEHLAALITWIILRRLFWGILCPSQTCSCGGDWLSSPAHSLLSSFLSEEKWVHCYSKRSTSCYHLFNSMNSHPHCPHPLLFQVTSNEALHPSRTLLPTLYRLLIAECSIHLYYSRYLDSTSSQRCCLVHLQSLEIYMSIHLAGIWSFSAYSQFTKWGRTYLPKSNCQGQVHLINLDLSC